MVFAVLLGIVIGLAGSAFYFCMDLAAGLRSAHPWLIFLLPLGGLAIVGFYHLLKAYKDEGTDLVISAVHSDSEIPARIGSFDLCFHSDHSSVWWSSRKRRSRPPAGRKHWKLCRQTVPL